MIFHEPSEGMVKTRLPASFFSHSVPVINLERWTGADVLISPYDISLPDKLSTPDLIPPHRIALEKHCKAGILIQRKSGNDFVSSIPKLAEIQARMNEWSDNPWLLVTDITEGEERFYMDGMPISGWSWAAISGAIDAWMDRGGSYRILPTGNIVTQWVLRREAKCKEWLEEPERVLAHKVPRQMVKIEDATWFNTKDAWPRGVGAKALRALAVYIAEEWSKPPTLANAISLACSDEATNIKGWGKKTVANVRTWYGVVESSPTSSWKAKSACLIFSGEGNERSNDGTT
jgi:hypothetical protein